MHLLYELDDEALARATKDPIYPKWATMCLLRSLGHPVLNACLVLPADSEATLVARANRLCAAAGADRLLLRSDGGVEVGRYYLGGNTFRLEDLIDRASGLLRVGRAVILTEPTNRFTNRLSATIRIDREGPQSRGGFVAEVLGPGFDVSDLTRGGIIPQVRITAGNVDWKRYDEPWWADFSTTVTLSASAQHRRRDQRLARIANEILPQLGVEAGETPLTKAAGWLREQGFNSLWQAWDPSVVARDLRRWYDDAYLVGNALLARRWRCLSLSFTRLASGRAMYWDVVDGQRKFGRGPCPRPRITQ